MVGHLAPPYYMSFSKEDDNSLSHMHNQPLHIKVMIHQKCVRWVLTNNGVDFYTVSTAFLRQLNWSKESIDPDRKITIKVYDEVKWKSLGLVVLSLHVGLIERDVTC